MQALGNNLLRSVQRQSFLIHGNISTRPRSVQLLRYFFTVSMVFLRVSAERWVFSCFYIILALPLADEAARGVFLDLGASYRLRI